jgi:hypothetical protein
MIGRPAGYPACMGDYESSTTVDAPVDDLFEFLSKVENLPRYMDRMTHARSLPGDAVAVEARVEPGDVGTDAGTDGGRTVGGEAWFRIDADRRSLSWGSEGPNDYRGELDVVAEGAGARVTVRIHTERDDAPGIRSGLEGTLATIRRLAATEPEVSGA